MAPFDLTKARKIIGKRLSMLREERTKSINEAATDAGIDPKTLLKIENGESDFRILTLRKLCKAYNVSLEELLSGPSQGGPD